MSNTGKHHDHETGRNLLWATLLNFLITAAEVIGGIISNSLALLSDALHNFSDGLAVFVAYVAQRISQRPSTLRKTFGYKRIQILAALFNASILFIICFYLIYEAYHRFIDPEPIKGLVMFIVASVGLIANVLALLLLQGSKEKNLNIRSAYLHLLGDTFSSVAVIAGGILIYFFRWYWVDPLLTFIISVYILFETWKVLRQTYDILMQGTPAGLDITAIADDLEKLDEIHDVHHIHAWNLDDQSIHFECHVNLNENLALDDTRVIHEKIEVILKGRYNINHITIQFEHNWCADKMQVEH